eukprot:m51a1_g1136 putative myotubularin-related protein 13 (1559) ;mRNA; r:230465-241184
MTVNPPRDYVITGNEVALLIAQDETDVAKLQFLYVKDERTLEERERKLRRRLMGARLTEFQISIFPCLAPTSTEFRDGGHVLVCTSSMTNISSFLQEIRRSLCSSAMPIVVLTQTCPNEDEWSQLSFIPELYVVQGSAVVYSDMERAGIQEAKHVIILSTPSPRAGESEDSDLIADTDTVLAYYNTQLNCKMSTERVLVDLTTMTNAKFFRPVSLSEKFVGQYGPAFIPSYASGRLFSISVFDTLLANLYFNDYIVAFVERLLNLNPEDDSCFLNQIPLPDEFCPTYGDLFDCLMHNDMIPLGLYRCNDDNEGSEPYVFTNPPRSTRVSENDSVYVLQRRGAQDSRTKWNSGGERCPNTVITGFMETSEGAPLVVHEALSRRDLAADWFYRKTPASDVAQIMTSFVACGLFVAETYTGEKYAFADYCWRLYLSENRFRYVFSIFGLIDVASILPSLLYAATKTNGFAFLRVVRLIQLVRVIHFFRILKNHFGSSQEVYPCPIPPLFANKTFHEAVTGSELVMTVNPPRDYLITGNEVALLVAQDETDVAKLQFLYVKDEVTLEQRERKLRRRVMGARITDFQISMAPCGPHSSPAPPSSKRCETYSQAVKRRPVEYALRDDFYQAGGHVLVCTSSMANMRLLLEEIRASLVCAAMPIVVLTGKCPDEHEWSQLSFIPDLFIVLGSSVVYSDMVRAGIQQARHIVLLSTPSPRAGESEDTDLIADTDTVLAYYNIQLNCPAVTERVIVDLTTMSNAKFFRPAQLTEKFVEHYGLAFMPGYASGRLLSISVLDSLLAQSYFNDYIIGVVEQLLDPIPYADACYLDQIPLPDPFCPTYGDLFDRLLHEGRIPVGLLRDTGSSESVEPYVYTNPPKTTPLHPSDKLFVLQHRDQARQQPLWMAVSRAHVSDPGIVFVKLDFQDASDPLISKFKRTHSARAVKEAFLRRHVGRSDAACEYALQVVSERAPAEAVTLADDTLLASLCPPGHSQQLHLALRKSAASPSVPHVRPVPSTSSLCNTAANEEAQAQAQGHTLQSHKALRQVIRNACLVWGAARGGSGQPDSPADLVAVLGVTEELELAAPPPPPPRPRSSSSPHSAPQSPSLSPRLGTESPQGRAQGPRKLSQGQPAPLSLWALEFSGCPRTSTPSSSKALFPNMWRFCFPFGIRMTKMPQQAKVFTFMTVDYETCDREYYTCLTFSEIVDPRKVALLSQKYGLVVADTQHVFAPVAIVVATRHFHLRFCRAWLRQLHKRCTAPEGVAPELMAAHLLRGVPAPVPGGDAVSVTIGAAKLPPLWLPAIGDLPLLEAPLRTVFGVLGPARIVSLVRCLLLERKVVFVSSSLSLLMVVTEAITGLMYPFRWALPYIPVLHAGDVDALGVPQGAVMGLHRDLITRSCLASEPEAVIVDIDTNNVTAHGYAPAPPFPPREESALLGDLHSAWNVDWDSTEWPGGLPEAPGTRPDFDWAVRAAFVKFFASLFRDYRRHVLYLRLFDKPEVKFDAHGFLQSNPDDMAAVASCLRIAKRVSMASGGMYSNVDLSSPLRFEEIWTRDDFWKTLYWSQ